MFRAPLGQDAELRLLQRSHAESVFAVVDRERDRLREWLPWVDATRSPADSYAFIESGLKQFAEDGSIHAGLFVEGAFAGVIGLHGIDHASRSTRIGYWLSSEFEGRGLMTRACKVLLAHVFLDMGLNRVLIECAVGNARSRAIPERLGFTNEGTAREAGWMYDRFVDLVQYSLLRSEWAGSAAAQG